MSLRISSGSLQIKPLSNINLWSPLFCNLIFMNDQIWYNVVAIHQYFITRPIYVCFWPTSLFLISDLWRIVAACHVHSVSTPAPWEITQCKASCGFPRHIWQSPFKGILFCLHVLLHRSTKPGQWCYAEGMKAGNQRSSRGGTKGRKEQGDRDDPPLGLWSCMHPVREKQVPDGYWSRMGTYSWLPRFYHPLITLHMIGQMVLASKTKDKISKG